MPSQLSSLLVRDGLASPQRIEHALARQVVRGGALDTNLLEMNIVAEEQLTQYLALATGLPAADKTDADQFDAEAIKKCPRDIADRYQVAPLTIDNGALRILVCEPVRIESLEDLANELRIALEPMVAPEYRFQVVFSRAYDSEPSQRYLEIADKLRDVTFTSGGGSTPYIVAAQESDRVVVDTPLMAPASPLTASDGDTDVMAAATPPVDVAYGAGPLKASAARELLANSEDRDEIFEVLVRGLRSVTGFAALLTIKGKSATCRQCLHDGSYDHSRVEEVTISLDEPSPFANSIKTGAPFIGSVTGVSDELRNMLALLGGVVPTAAIILPVSLRGRVVALAYGHSGDSGSWIGGASKVFPIASATAEAIERLLARKSQGKSKSSSAEQSR